MNHGERLRLCACTLETLYSVGSSRSNTRRPALIEKTIARLVNDARKWEKEHPEMVCRDCQGDAWVNGEVGGVESSVPCRSCRGRGKVRS